MIEQLVERGSGGESPSRIVVVGSGGRLGKALMGALASTHYLVGLDHEHLDLGSQKSIEAALAPMDFDHLILAAALTAVDYCEEHPSETMAVNADGPGWIARIAADKGAHLTYLSSDMVFDGEKDGPYTECDLPHPLCVYGESKLVGEHRVLAADSNNLVVRVSWLFGAARAAFPEWIIQKACNEPTVTLPDNKICCPTYSDDLVQWLRVLLFGNGTQPAHGIYHLCQSGSCSWLEWGQYCIEVARQAGAPIVTSKLKGVDVDQVAAFVAKRAHNTAMSTEKFTARCACRPRPWQEAVSEHIIKTAVW